MKLSAQTMRELLKTDPPLVTGVADRLSQPLEGSKIDLTLASVSTLLMQGNLSAFMGIDVRKTPPTLEMEPGLLPYSPNIGKTNLGWTLFPGFYLNLSSSRS